MEEQEKQAIKDLENEHEWFSQWISDLKKKKEEIEGNKYDRENLRNRLIAMEMAIEMRMQEIDLTLEGSTKTTDQPTPDIIAPQTSSTTPLEGVGKAAAMLPTALHNPQVLPTALQPRRPQPKLPPLNSPPRAQTAPNTPNSSRSIETNLGARSDSGYMPPRPLPPKPVPQGQVKCKTSQCKNFVDNPNKDKYCSTCFTKWKEERQQKQEERRQQSLQQAEQGW